MTNPDLEGETAMIFVEIVVQFSHYWFRTRPYSVAALLNVGVFVPCYVLCSPPSKVPII